MVILGESIFWRTLILDVNSYLLKKIMRSRSVLGLCFLVSSAICYLPIV